MPLGAGGSSPLSRAQIRARLPASVTPAADIVPLTDGSGLIPAGFLPASPAYTGDVTKAAGGTVLSITPRAITSAMLSLADGGTVNADRNLLINGTMDIWQRGPTIAGVTAGYGPDRWRVDRVGTAAFTVSQVTPPTTAQAERLLTNAMGVTVSTAQATVGAGDYAVISQRLEGYDTLPMAGRQITLSFMSWTNVAGTYMVALRNAIGDRSYIAAITCAASTWERQSVTLTFHDLLSGTWGITYSTGVEIGIVLAAGSNFQSTAGSWLSANKIATSAIVTNFLATVSNRFQIADVTLNLGGARQPSEPTKYGEILRRCERYFQKSYDVDVIPGSVSTTGSWTGVALNSADFYAGFIPLRCAMRDVPTITPYSTNTGTTFKVWDNTGGADRSAGSTRPGRNGFTIQGLTSMTVGNIHWAHWTAESEL